MFKRWEEKKELPGVDSLTFANGAVILLDWRESFDNHTKEKKAWCTPLCDTSFSRIGKYDSDCWVSVDSWSFVEHKGGKIYGGDGAMGNEGSLVYIDADNNFVWGFFFTQTNPISFISVSNDILMAINEHSELKLEINLNNLTEIDVEVVMFPNRVSV